MLKVVSLAALALSLSLATAVQAQSQAQPRPEDEADLQCLAGMTYVLGIMPRDESQESADAVASIVGAASYFLGRLEGRSPGINWGERLANFGNSHTVEEIEPHLARCADEFAERTAALEESQRGTGN
jgi:hypothetical protein